VGRRTGGYEDAELPEPSPSSEAARALLQKILADIKAGNPDAALSRLDALQTDGTARPTISRCCRIASPFPISPRAWTLRPTSWPAAFCPIVRAATGLGCGLCRLSTGSLCRCRPASGKAGAKWRGAGTAARPGGFLGGARPYATGDPQKVVSLLAAAAKEEPTFYGLIAERMLGMDTNTGFSDAVLSQNDFTA
jgi:soluble lytic murein transglycosylase